MKRRTGAAVFVLCLVPSVLILANGRLRFVPFFAGTWELPGPLPWLFLAHYLVAFPLVYRRLPSIWRRSRVACLAVGVAVSCLLALGLLSSAVNAADRFYFGRRLVVHLEDPGPYERAAIVSTMDTRLRAVREGRCSWERISEAEVYLPSRPVELRKPRGRPCYLFVDRDRRACGMLELDGEPGPRWCIAPYMPFVEELRTEFGADLMGVAGNEDY